MLNLVLLPHHSLAPAYFYRASPVRRLIPTLAPAAPPARPHLVTSSQDARLFVHVPNVSQVVRSFSGRWSVLRPPFRTRCCACLIADVCLLTCVAASSSTTSSRTLAASVPRLFALVRTHQDRDGRRKAIKRHHRRTAEVAAAAQAELDSEGQSDEDDPFRREVAYLPTVSKGVPEAPPGMDEFSHLLSMLMEYEQESHGAEEE